MIGKGLGRNRWALAVRVLYTSSGHPQGERPPLSHARNETVLPSKLREGKLRNMNAETHSCCFCDGLVRGTSGAPWDTILHDSDRFVITPTKGSLVPGWLLVVAKTHAICTGAISTNECQELKSCLARAQDLVRQNFGPPTVFEHGPFHPNTTLGCGIDHLHLHVAPLSFSLRNAVNRLFPATEWRTISDLSGTNALFDAHIGYGIVQEPNDRMYWCQPPAGIRQFFRRAIACELEMPAEFDYAEFPHLLNVRHTLRHIPQASS